MKKVLIALLTLTLTVSAVACGSDDAEDTAANTTDAAVTTVAPATTAAQTDAPETDAPEDDTPAPEIEFTAYPLSWADNNGGAMIYYEITANDDGSTHVVYTMETYADALANYSYAGYSWVNMAADVSEFYNGQIKFVMKIKGLAGDTLLIKPFDDQNLEQTITFDGSEQVIEFDLTGVSDPASTYIILFGAAGACDASGEFDIISAGFVE